MLSLTSDIAFRINDMFLKAMWHMLKVVSAAGYWLLTVGLVWGGIAALGSQPALGWALIILVAGLFAVRVYVGGRFVPAGTAYVMAFAAYIAVLVVPSLFHIAA
jgi:hypothetical protein